MNQISFKNGQKRAKIFAIRVGLEPGTALGVVSIIET